MKNLKLLNNKYLPIILFFYFLDLMSNLKSLLIFGILKKKQQFQENDVVENEEKKKNS